MLMDSFFSAVAEQRARGFFKPFKTETIKKHFPFVMAKAVPAIFIHSDMHGAVHSPGSYHV